MKVYKAYLEQGQGCDYTIGCGVALVNISAKSMEEAQANLTKLISDCYSHDESKIVRATLLEVSQSFEVDVKEILKDEKQKRLDQKKLDQEKKERAEFERLKAKFETE